MIVNISIVFILFLFWAFFAGVETAFISANRFKLNNLKRRGNRSAALAYSLLNKPEKLIITTLIGINISLVLSANISAVIFTEIFGEPKPVYSIVIVTLLSLIFTEVIPKNLAIKNSLKVTLFSSYPMYGFYILFYPLGKMFSFASKIVIRMVNIAHTGLLPLMFTRKEDVEIFLTDNLKKKFTKEESRYFVESLDFGKKLLSDIMVPLVEIRALPLSEKIAQCFHFIEKYKKFYIPVYSERVDNIVGVVYIHDLFGKNRSLALSEVMREPYFVPERKNINELYRELYEHDIPIVFAVDEHGGITGMGTIYDIGEEIIGKISSFESKKNLIVKIHEGEYLCDGEVEIDEIDALLSIDIVPEDFTTLNGLILSILKRIPNKGDYIDIDRFRFIVEKASKKRAELIRIVSRPIAPLTT